MPKHTGTLQGLMGELWNLKYRLNKPHKLLDNESYDQIQGMKTLIANAEAYCLDNGTYASRLELEDEEFKATRPVNNESNGDT